MKTTSVLLPVLLVASLSACSTMNYSLIESEFSWKKNGETYFSKNPYKINNKTGETYRMSYEKDKGYYWKPVSHINLNTKDSQ